MENFVTALHHKLSTNSVILTASDPGFEAAYERWTNIDRKTPAVIVQPANERDVAVLVSEAQAAKVPFVPTTGGHSHWSTVEDGMIIDMCRYKEIIIRPDERNATIRGGVLMKELQLALSEKGLFTTVANGSTVGVIPYMIGGGISSYTPLIGYACENILTAKIVVAKGDVVVASDSENPDLLWAIRGTGQFFGIVTELLIRTYSSSLMGPNRVRQLGTIFFPPQKAFEACEALKKIVSASDHACSGHLMAMIDSSKGHVLMVAHNMGPLEHTYLPSTFDKHSDHLGWMCPKGDLKRFSQTGLASINPENFSKLVDLHRELLATLPGTERSVFTIEWHTPTLDKIAQGTKTSFGLKEVEIWLNILTWYTDPNIHDQVLQFDRRAQEVMRSDTKEEAYVAYTNTSRDAPIEDRYKDATAVKKLKELKQHWDPNGCFTQQLL